MTAPADRVRLNAARCHRSLSVPAGSYVPIADIGRTTGPGWLPSSGFLRPTAASAGTGHCTAQELDGRPSSTTGHRAGLMPEPPNGLMRRTALLSRAHKCPQSGNADGLLGLERDDRVPFGVPRGDCVDEWQLLCRSQPK